jgi:hypothetical protein
VAGNSASRAVRPLSHRRADRHTVRRDERTGEPVDDIGMTRVERHAIASNVHPAQSGNVGYPLNSIVVKLQFSVKKFIGRTTS